MAKGTTYPKLPKKLWWLLREKFKKTIPSVVTPTFVASLAPMKDESARSNVIKPLKELGLLDEMNKPTPLAERWRHDDEYKTVCHQIRASVYPAELIEAFPDPIASQKDTIATWFAKTGQVGEVAAKMYTDLYILLSEADFSQSEESMTSSTSPKASRPITKVKPKAVPVATVAAAHSLSPVVSTVPAQIPEVAAQLQNQQPRLPAIHIDVQVHISPDTTPDQIDRIFESMAKHLGGFVK